MFLAKSLSEIANSYGTDKGTIGPSRVYGGHNYTDIYEGYMSGKRYDEIFLLEIGIGVKGPRWDARIVHGRNISGGASIKMWHEYFPFGQIYGIDINRANQFNSRRIHTFVIDQSNPDDLRKFRDEHRDTCFDFIIDDGSHRADDQQLTFSLLFQLLKPGGVYFIEDFYNNGLGDSMKARHSSKTVHNTRKILRSFVDDGSFLTPNALHDTEYLEQNIKSISFHAPISGLVPSAFIARLLGKRGIFIQCIPGTERMCAIRKC